MSHKKKPLAVSSKPVSKRVDAQRNMNQILSSARTLFSTMGVNAPVRDIAEKAGVGIGTLYRHFPQRSDLIAAVFRNEVDECAKAGSELSAQYPAGDALILWIERYVEFIVARQGLATALNTTDPAFKNLPEYFRQQLCPVVQDLLDAAITAGEIRPDILPEELLYAIAGLCTPPECTTASNAWRLVSLFIDGLRYGAGRT